MSWNCCRSFLLFSLGAHTTFIRAFVAHIDSNAYFKLRAQNFLSNSKKSLLERFFHIACLFWIFLCSDVKNVVFFVSLTFLYISVPKVRLAECTPIFATKYGHRMQSVLASLSEVSASSARATCGVSSNRRPCLWTNLTQTTRRWRTPAWSSGWSKRQTMTDLESLHWTWHHTSQTI